MMADGGMASMNSAGSLHDSGGHVRFVDSTIRSLSAAPRRFGHVLELQYNFRIHPGSRWVYWNSRSVLEKVLIILTLTLAAFSTIMLLVITSNVSIQADYVGFNTGNGEKLSYSQVAGMAWLCLDVA